MTLLVGRVPERDGDGALALALRLARAWSEDLVVATVHPGPPGVGPAPPLPDDVAVTVTDVVDRSIPGGLVRAARAHGASMLVLGDGPLRPGTVVSRLARAADLPVALAAGDGHDGDRHDDAPITRITCAWGTRRESHGVLAAAADLAARSGAALRVASFAARRPPTIPPEIGLDAEGDVVAAWRDQVLTEQAEALARRGLTGETVARDGAEIAGAIAAAGWEDGDLLVLGAPTAGTATRVLLGDPGAAVLRASPVPAIVVPPGS